MNEGSFIVHSMEFLYGKDEYKEHFQKLLDSLVLLITDVNRGEKFQRRERIEYLDLLSQKFILHCFSIKKLVEGIKLESLSKKIAVPISDPFSINSLIRTGIENFLVVNFLSNRKCDLDLLDGRYEIWMMHGLKQRNVVPETEEEVRVVENDKKSIFSLENSIKKRHFYEALSKEAKGKFLRDCKKRDWKIIFESEKYYVVSWKRLLEEAGIKKEIRGQIYNYLSWHVHSQSISVLQLKKMWESGFDQESIKISINKLNMIIAFLISDLVHSDDRYNKIYLELNEEYRNLIEFYNLSFRGADYAKM